MPRPHWVKNEASAHRGLSQLVQNDDDTPAPLANPVGSPFGIIAEELN